MTDTELKRREAICKAAGVNDIGELSDGFHTFNGLYEQRMILFAALVKAYKDKSWKSYRHEDGEYCFGGGWFIVGIDTPEGSYTYHYESKYWDMFDCSDLPRAKHWDGHTEADAETRLISLEQTHWIPVTERPPEEEGMYLVTFDESCIMPDEGQVSEACWLDDQWQYEVLESSFVIEPIEDLKVTAWMPLPPSYKGDEE